MPKTLILEQTDLGKAPSRQGKNIGWELTLWLKKGKEGA